MNSILHIPTMLDSAAKVPKYAHYGDAGLDFCTTKTVLIEAHSCEIVGTGVHMAIPEGCVGLCFPRSGIASKLGVDLANCVSVIDSSYRGEIRAPLRNYTDRPVMIAAGDRIMQMIILPYPLVILELVDSLDETERGEGGFGSSGRS